MCRTGYRWVVQSYENMEERLKEAQKSPESEAILFFPAEGQRGLFKASNAEKIYQGLFAFCCGFGAQITKSRKDYESDNIF